MQKLFPWKWGYDGIMSFSTFECNKKYKILLLKWDYDDYKAKTALVSFNTLKLIVMFRPFIQRINRGAAACGI